MNALTETTIARPAVIRRYSNCSDSVFRLACSALELCEYDLQRFEEMMVRSFPELSVYRGHTHLRFMPYGDSSVSRISFYVAKEGA